MVGGEEGLHDTEDIVESPQVMAYFLIQVRNKPLPCLMHWVIQHATRLRLNQYTSCFLSHF